MPSPEALARADRILDSMAVLWTEDREDARNAIAEAIDEARLMTELAAGRERVLRWADADRLIAWLDTPEVDRKPANIAFSEGNERQIAYRFEGILSDIHEIIGEMAWGAGGPLPTLTDSENRVLSRESVMAVYESLRQRLRSTRGGWLKAERARVAELERRVADLEARLAEKES